MPARDRYGVPGIAVALALWLIKRQVKNLPDGRADSGTLGEHTITISTEGLREKTSVNDSFCSWKAVRDITETSGYLFIFLDRHMAHAVPKRAFATPEQASEFLEKAREYWRQGGAKSGETVLVSK